MSDRSTTILATDCGSTTTKAILVEWHGGEYRLMVRGEAPTTVEAPFDDVTVGVLNAVREVEELSGKRFIADERVKTPRENDVGADHIHHVVDDLAGWLQALGPGPEIPDKAP